MQIGTRLYPYGQREIDSAKEFLDSNDNIKLGKADKESNPNSYRNVLMAEELVDSIAELLDLDPDQGQAIFSYLDNVIQEGFSPDDDGQSLGEQANNIFKFNLESSTIDFDEDFYAENDNSGDSTATYHGSDIPETDDLQAAVNQVQAENFSDSTTDLNDASSKAKQIVSSENTQSDDASDSTTDLNDVASKAKQIVSSGNAVNEAISGSTVINGTGSQSSSKALERASFWAKKGEREKAGIHARAVLMNFMRDVVREKNFSSLVKDKDYSDSNGTNWKTTSVSLVGSHTKGVNSDAKVEASENSSILGAVIDGVTIPLTDVERNKHDVLTNEMIRHADDGTQPNSEKFDRFSNEREALREEIINRQGSHLFAETLANHLNSFKLGKLAKPSELEDKSADYNPAKLNFYKRMVKENPLEFWQKLMNKLTENFDSESFLSSKNPFDDLIQFLEANNNQAAEELDSLLGQIKNPGIAEVLKDLEVRQTLAALAPIPLFEKKIANEMKTKLADLEKKSSVAATMTYLIDLGNKVARVHVGDCFNDVFDKDGNKLNQKDSTNSRGFIAMGLDPQLGTSHFNDSHFHHGGFDLQIFDKKDIAKAFLASDGVVEHRRYEDPKPDYKQELADVLKASWNNSPTETAKAVLDYSALSKDDKTMVILQQAA